MTLDELIERLTALRDMENIPGSAEINGAFQQHYPLVADVTAITVITNPDGKDTVVYIALGGIEAYGSGQEWYDDIIDLSGHNWLDGFDCACRDCQAPE